MSVRGVLVACAVLCVLAARPLQGQSESVSVTPAPAGAGLVVAEPNGANAPLLRSVVSLDLRNVTLRDALREISERMGGRLMYDESVTALKHRVTLRESEVSLGRALRRILDGTDVQVFVSQGASGGQLVLLKRVAPPPPVDSTTLRGVVVDSASGAPLPQVMVYLDGARRRAMTNANGVFTFTKVPVGEHDMVVRRIGFAPWRRTITVTVAEQGDVQIRLVAVPTMLDDVVTTGSGDRQRKEVGNSISVIDAEEDVAKNAYANLSDILAGRGIASSTPGSGSVNSPTRHRIRGLNSINASNDPIVIIDGIRANTNYETCRGDNVRGCNNLPSRFDDFDLDDIESVEVLKGPSAAALWGSDAANGVIVIRTKRGHAGPTRWTFSYDEGFTTAPTDIRVPVQGLGHAANGTALVPCTLLDQAKGYCVASGEMAGGFNRFAHPRTTSVATGRRTDLNLSAAGGTEQMQFFIAGGHTDEMGTAKMPEIDQKLLRQSLGMELPGWMVRPDAKATTTLTGRITGQFSRTADYAISTNFIQVKSRTGQDGINGATSDLRSEADTFELSRGWEQFHMQRDYDVTRFIGGVQANWRPVDWFSGHASIGRDYAFNGGGEASRRGWCLPYCTTTSREALGRVYYGEGRDMTQTIDMRGNFTIPTRHGIALRTTAGAQHTRITGHDLEGDAYDLPIGRIDLSSAPAANRSVRESNDDRATFGMFLDQQIAFRDRLFVNAAVRQDVSSQIGADVAPVYPKWSISWLASEEPFLAPLRDRGLSSLRLRTAFGQAGVQPGSSAKLRTYSQLPRFVDADGSFGSNYAILNSVGNAELRPERSTEFEGGFDVGLWNDRVLLEFTSYRKMQRDAIVQRPLAPSIGQNSTARQYYNVGNVKNWGTEMNATVRMIDRSDVQASVHVAYSSTSNELVSLGAGVEPFSITASNINLATAKHNDGVVMPGYPLFSRWARPLAGYSDANGDGIITADEVKFADTLVFIGGSLPDAEIAVMPSLGLWNGRVTLNAGFDYAHGVTQLNDWAATTRFFTQESYDPSTPLNAQACIVAAASHANQYCFFETVNVLRLRTASLGVTMPTRVSDLVRARSMSLHLMGSNLGVWSGYNGMDPMMNTAAADGNRTIGGAAVPRGRTWTVRARLTY